MRVAPMDLFKKLIAPLTLFVLLVLLLIPVLSCFDGVRKSHGLCPLCEQLEGKEDFIYLDCIHYEAIKTLFRRDVAIDHKLELYEDNLFYYLVDKNLHPWASPWSFYAKEFGICIRKKDGYVLRREINDWIPAGYISYSKKEISDKKLLLGNIDSITKRFGPGLHQTHFKAFTNNIFAGIMERRIYIARDGEVDGWYLNAGTGTNVVGEIRIEALYGDRE
jgi:hypothetical protein